MSADKIIDLVITEFEMPRRTIKLSAAMLLGDVGTRKHHANGASAPNSSSIEKGRRALTSEDKAKLAKLLNRELCMSRYERLIGRHCPSNLTGKVRMKSIIRGLKRRITSMLQTKKERRHAMVGPPELWETAH